MYSERGTVRGIERREVVDDWTAVFASSLKIDCEPCCALHYVILCSVVRAKTARFEFHRVAKIGAQLEWEGWA